jgi:D-sedoheptulose 7-phosphate isomerase
MEKFIQHYITSLQKTLGELDQVTIAKFIQALEDIHEAKGTIYILGNGGSAATASHMENDLGMGLKLRELRNFRVKSLSDNSAVCTAIANDIGYENIFYAQLKDKLTIKDMVIAISCSGNSANIVKAMEYANDQGAKTVGITGFSGGKLKEMSALNIHVPTQKGEYGICEDIHMVIDHIVFSYYLSFKENASTTYELR